MLTCKEVTRIVSDSMDRKLPIRQRMAVKMHLLMCKFCSRYSQQLLFIRKAIHHYSSKMDDAELPSTTMSLSTEVRQRIKRLIAEKK